jgi:hypothetical protein
MAAQGRTTRRRHHQGARDHGPITASKIPVKSKMARRRIRRSLDAR